MIIDNQRKKGKKGLTFIELLMVIIVFGILVLSIVPTYVMGIKTWSRQFDHLDMRGRLSQAMELISRDVRQITSIGSLTESGIIFTAYLGWSQTCYLYLHNEDDPLPSPPYSESEYDLRYTCYSTTYGDGPVIVENIPQPTRAVFSRSGDLLTIDITVSKNNVPIRIRSNVNMRNL